MRYVEELRFFSVQSLSIEGQGGSVCVEEVNRFINASCAEATQGIYVFVQINVQQMGVPFGQCAVLGVCISRRQCMARLIGVQVVVLSFEEIKVPRDQVNLGIAFGHFYERGRCYRGIHIPIHGTNFRAFEVILKPLFSEFKPCKQATRYGYAFIAGLLMNGLGSCCDVRTTVGDGCPGIVLSDRIPCLFFQKPCIDFWMAPF